MMIPPALRSRAGGAPSVWRHTRRGDRYARRGHRLGPRTRPQWSGSPAGYGPEPIQEGPQELAHRPGRALETDRPGFKSAAGEELPKARAVMDPIPRRLPGLPASSTSPPHPVGRPQGAGAGQETGSTGPGTRCTPAPTCSPIPRPGTLRPCSPTSATLRSMPAGAFTSA